MLQSHADRWATPGWNSGEVRVCIHGRGQAGKRANFPKSNCCVFSYLRLFLCPLLVLSWGLQTFIHVYVPCQRSGARKFGNSPASKVLPWWAQHFWPSSGVYREVFERKLRRRLVVALALRLEAIASRVEAWKKINAGVSHWQRSLLQFLLVPDQAAPATVES